MDLDGTLADTARDIVPALNVVCAEQGRPPVSYEQACSHVSQGARAILQLAFGKDLDEAFEQQLVDRILEVYGRAPYQATRLFDGMPELIEYFAQHNMPWGIVTNKSEELARPVMTAFDFAAPPGCLIGRRPDNHPKPHPQPLLRAAEELGVPAAQCLYLGDDPRDMQAADAAGMIGIVAGFGYIAPDANISEWGGQGTIDHPLELIDWLQ